MTDTILAQGSKLEGWIQGIVVLLVIGGSLLKPITKALIEHFGPKDSASPTGQTRSTGDSAVPRPPVRPPVAPTPPVARAPQARPVTLPHQPAPSRPRPPASPKPQPATQRPRPSQPTTKPKKAVSRTEDRLGHLKPTVKEHLGHVDSVIELRDDQIEQVVEEHLGHLEPSTAPTGSKKRAARGPESWLRPTAGTLRRAVVLSEVLQPPLALRKPEG